MSETLYRKYRPKTFSEMIGNALVTQAIENSIMRNKISHCYLFSGPRGIGKTTISRLIAKRINCISYKNYEPCNLCRNCKDIDANSFPDLIEIDAASNRGIDEIRSIKDKVNYLPFIGSRKIYIIDEIHMLTKEAFNAMLKLLEEPPKHIIFILATTEKNKIPQTILSRCQKYDFSLVSSQDISKSLKYILEKEKRDLDEESIDLIARESSGSLRDAVTLLDKLLSSYENLDFNKIRKILGIIPLDILKTINTFIKSKDKQKMLNFIDELWYKSIDLENTLKQFAQYGVDDLDLDLKLNIYDIIFSTFLSFKNEDNKRIICYIIINKIFKLNDLISDKSNLNNIDESTEIFKTIKSSWNDICDKVKDYSLSLMIFLKQSKLLKLENNILYITFNQNIEFYKTTLEKPDNALLLEKIISDILDIKIRIKII